MPRRIESLFIQGPAGRLEALLEEPESNEPIEAALVCHPHPQHGGTMHNKVVYRLAGGLRRSGCVALRFNYRGVNMSEGSFGDWIGEAEDAHAALGELRRRYPDLPVLVSGFSFGSRIALKLAADEPELQRVIAVGFPTRYPNREYVHEVRIPKFFIQSTNDEFGPEPEFRQFYETLNQPKRLEWVPAADHFFAGALPEFQDAVERFGRIRLGQAGGL
jgi:alpha/beta superfamily hydrolase